MNSIKKLTYLFSGVNVHSLAGPLLILMILGMMVLPLPAFLLDMMFTFNIALSIMVLLVSIHTHKPLDFAVFPDGFAAFDAIAAVAQCGIHPHRADGRPYRTRCCGKGNRGIRPLSGRRQLHGRHCGVHYSRGDQFYRDHQGRRPHRRSRRALYFGRHARQADGDRRRPERRPHW